MPSYPGRDLAATESVLGKVTHSADGTERVADAMPDVKRSFPRQEAMPADTSQIEKPAELLTMPGSELLALMSKLASE